MRSLLVLSAVFALLVTYLESMGQPRQTTIQPLLTAKVIRAPLNSPQTIVQEQKAAVAAALVTRQTPLNLTLKLPSLNIIQQRYIDSKSTVLDLFKPSKKETITYNAELVFDAETGEDITGGKVNIKIPFG